MCNDSNEVACCWRCVGEQVNPEYITRLEEKGLRFVGRSEDGERMEIMELDSKGFLFLFVIFIYFIIIFYLLFFNLFYFIFFSGQ